MPTALPRACPVCGHVIEGSRCQSCTTQRQQRQPSAFQRGYTHQWSRYSRDFRAQFPFCGQRADGVFHGEHSLCSRAGFTILGHLVDHIQPVLSGGDMWNPANHQTLCRRCHALKTQDEPPRW